MSGYVARMSKEHLELALQAETYEDYVAAIEAKWQEHWEEDNTYEVGP